jgi:two-component system, cell cycle sensor histidine kinase and response regulator CckA
MRTSAPRQGVFSHIRAQSGQLGKRKWWQLASARIAIAFVVWSAAWVLLCDAAMHFFMPGVPAPIWTLETVKAVVYVAVTAIMLFYFARVREKEYFAASRSSENRLRRVSESNLIAICYWKPSGEITDANDAFLNLVGSSRNELLNNKLNWFELTPPEYKAAELIRVEQLLATGQQVNFEQELLRKDQTRVPVLVGSVMLDPSKTRGVAFILETSELKAAKERNTELESQLRQAQKLEAVGQLASGIAHDFNNLLNIMIGYTCLIETRAQSESIRENAKHILMAAGKASSLIRKLLAFGRKQRLSPELVDINASLLEYEHFLPRIIGENIRYELRLSPALWLVKVDRNQLEQVIVNLVINARDAMPEGGVLTISTRNHEQTDEVLLSVRDSGTGMTEQVKSRIFDPFFTTKPDGQGSGLGLSTVHGIVTQSGGRIVVDTELGKGTSFAVHFPRATESKELRMSERKVNGKDQKLPEPLPISRNPSKTILFAEDETELREVIAIMLRMQGYSVIPAKNGQEAVLLAETHEGPIDLLLTDITMPYKNGIEAAEAIRKVRPGISVIYMTGYAEQAISMSGNDALLEKPVPPPVLFQKVRESLEGQMSTRTLSR